MTSPDEAVGVLAWSTPPPDAARAKAREERFVREAVESFACMMMVRDKVVASTPKDGEAG